MKITQAILDDLTAKAKESPRLRMNLDLRDSAEDTSQRMLNAIEPGSPLPIHRHQKTSETVVCLRGRLVEEFYDDLERTCTERIELSPNGPVVALNIPAGQCRGSQYSSWAMAYRTCIGIWYCNPGNEERKV